MVLARQEATLTIWKGVGDRRDCIAESLETLFSAYHQRWNGDRRTAFAQHGPGVEDREVVRRGVNDQLVPFPCAWHQQWHRPSKRSRCPISIIASDSFSGPTEIVRGWTPTSHGVFTDNLDRTRRQLATNFESKSASLAAGAEWTDSIGGHWHLKILFDAAETEARSDTHSRTIWIFSDMMNQTPDFDIVRMLNLPRNVCWSEQR